MGLNADRQRIFVDAKMRVVHVPRRPFLRIAAADKQEGSRDFLLIGGEILAAE